MCTRLSAHVQLSPWHQYLTPSKYPKLVTLSNSKCSLDLRCHYHLRSSSPLIIGFDLLNLLHFLASVEQTETDSNYCGYLYENELTAALTKA